MIRRQSSDHLAVGFLGKRIGRVMRAQTRLDMGDGICR